MARNFLCFLENWPEGSSVSEESTYLETAHLDPWTLSDWGDETKPEPTLQWTVDGPVKLPAWPMWAAYPEVSGALSTLGTSIFSGAGDEPEGNAAKINTPQDMAVIYCQDGSMRFLFEGHWHAGGNLYSKEDMPSSVLCASTTDGISFSQEQTTFDCLRWQSTAGHKKSETFYDHGYVSTPHAVSIGGKTWLLYYVGSLHEHPHRPRAQISFDEGLTWGEWEDAKSYFESLTYLANNETDPAEKNKILIGIGLLRKEGMQNLGVDPDIVYLEDAEYKYRCYYKNAPHSMAIPAMTPAFGASDSKDGIRWGFGTYLGQGETLKKVQLGGQLVSIYEWVPTYDLTVVRILNTGMLKDPILMFYCRDNDIWWAWAKD